MGWRIIAALASACAPTLARCCATSWRQLVPSLRQKILGATLLIAEATAATFRGRRDPHHRRASGRAYARPQSTQDQPLISSVNTSGALNLTGLPSFRLTRDGGFAWRFCSFLIRLHQISHGNFEHPRQFIQRDHSRIPPPPLQTAQILLADPGTRLNLFLRQAPSLAQPGKILSHQLPHIHAACIARLHNLSL